MLPLCQLWYQLLVDGCIFCEEPSKTDINSLEEHFRVCLADGVLDFKNLTDSLARKYRLVSGEEFTCGCIDDLPDVLTLEQWKNLRVFPFRKTETSLDFFLDNPTNDTAFSVLSELPIRVQYLLISPRRMDALWGSAASSRELDEPLMPVSEPKYTSEITIDSLFSECLETALKSSSTDIHLEQSSEVVQIRCRIRGRMEKIQQLNEVSGEQLITYIMQKSGMNANEPRKPQDGSFRVLTGGFPIEIRVSSVVGVLGVSLVLRLLPVESSSPTISELGLSKDQEKASHELLKTRDGMILISGPTGAGKSTTLYSWLKEMNSVERKLITIEDPVEMRLKGVNQIQVNRKAGLGYADALKSILRQSPDVILLGEIRDAETASLAVNAALSGHLLLSTVHSKSVFGVIDRLLDLDVDRVSLASALQAVISQRLLPMLCPHCRKETSISDFDEIGISSETILYGKGEGCGHCLGTGYYRQTAAYEMLLINEAHRREMITTGSLRSENINMDAYYSLSMTLKEKLIAGDIGIEDYWMHVE